jgi:hypothetical protein
MKFLPLIRTLAGRFFPRRRMEEELEQELRSHILHRADDLERSGLARAEAERQAHIEFGSYGRFREGCYEALGAHAVETGGTRCARQRPRFAQVARLYGGRRFDASAGHQSECSSVWILNGLILRPLNVPHAESL